MSLSRYQRGMNGAAWNAYIAGRYAESRDAHMTNAREATDIDMRRLQVRHARQSHWTYLKSARRAQPPNLLGPTERERVEMCDPNPVRNSDLGLTP